MDCRCAASLRAFSARAIVFDSGSPAALEESRACSGGGAGPDWDPLRAEKAIEVGKFYMKKGDYDAAIDRFRDAAYYHPGYALPFKLLGEAQEKKGLKSEAVKSYEQYLKLYPHAEDREKVQKRIDKLYHELDRAKKKQRSG